MHLDLGGGREIRGIFAAEGGENPTNFYFFFTPRYMKRDVSVNQVILISIIQLADNFSVQSVMNGSLLVYNGFCHTDCKSDLDDRPSDRVRASV